MPLLQITGQETRFINSGDSAMVIKGQVPTVIVAGVNTTKPGTGSLVLTGNALQLGNVVSTPGTGSLSIIGRGTQGGSGNTAEPSTQSLAISSDAVQVGASVSPTTGALTLLGQATTRGVGLRIEGQSPSAEIAHNRSMLLGSALISSDAPQIIVVDPTADAIRVPPTALVNVTGAGMVAVRQPIIIPVGSLSVVGIAPTKLVETQNDPGTASLTISSDAPLVNSDPVIVFITELGPDKGVPITNLNATTDSLNRYNLCDRTGFKQKPHTLVQDPYGNYVRAESSDGQRHPQERVKSQPESQRGSIRPEPTRDDELTFLADNEVQAEDL